MLIKYSFWVIGLVLMLGCSSPEPAGQKGVQSCTKQSKSQKQWEQEQKIVYINKHTQDESFKDIVVDKYGNSYITKGNKLTKYNCHQKKVWEVDLLNSPKGAYGFKKTLGIDDRYVYVVFRFNSSTFIVKYDFNGNKFLIGKYNFSTSTAVESVAIDKRGNILLAAAPIGGSGDYGFVSKYNDKGKKVWFKKYLDIYFYSVAIDKNGDLFVVGDTMKDKASLIVKYDSQGNLLWKKTFKNIDKKDTVTFFSIDIDNKNNLYVSGHTSWYKAYLLKFTPSGKKIWSKKTHITGYGMTSGSSVLCATDGKIYLAGHPIYPSGDKGYKYRLAVAKYNASGKLLTRRMSSMQETINRNDKLIYKFNFYQQYKRKDGTFYIVQDGKTIYDNLKYVKILSQEKNGNKIQTIDEHNKSRIVFIKGNEVQAVPHPLLSCGNGFMTHQVDIVKSNQFIKVEVKIGYLDENIIKEYKDVNKTHNAIKVSESKVDELFFRNNKIQIMFETNDNKFKRTIYYKKDNQYGFWGSISADYKFAVNRKNKVVYSFKKSKENNKYDILEFKEKERILLGKNSLLGYYKITPIKYKILNDFKESLARFELPDGRKGYIDTKGNEYYD